MATATLAGCGGRDSPRSDGPAPSRKERVDRALSAAVHFLTHQQAPDGAWRSDTYGAFKDGGSLTPLVLETLAACPQTDESTISIQQGANYLAAMVQPDGRIEPGPHGLSYPVYTAALAVTVLGNPRHESARTAWLNFLRERQLTEPLGWQPSDKEYGGWGFSHDSPRKPRPGEPRPPLTESNLSATVFALEALRAAGGAAEEPAFRKALRFVQRCQNFQDDPACGDPAFDDGGFFFIYDDPVRNKAGRAGTDRTGKERFSSYGSTTADGLRCLLACGLPPDEARVSAARRWLESHCSVTTHPGKYASDREGARPAVYYYYCWSLARALTSAGVQELRTPAGPVRWADALTEELLKRQQADGSWSNEAVAVREDDPLVATSLAAGALAVCQRYGDQR
jgi:squalene-hopene/tetraprenyl-beta-curcumene cyclase